MRAVCSRPVHSLHVGVTGSVGLLLPQLLLGYGFFWGLFSVHVSPLSIWPFHGAPTAFLLLLIATDLRGQELRKWVLAAISRFKEGVAARLREQKQRWKQREPSEVPFMTADSFIGTCRRATLLIIHTHTHTRYMWSCGIKPRHKVHSSSLVSGTPPSFSSQFSTSGRFPSLLSLPVFHLVGS